MKNTIRIGFCTDLSGPYQDVDGPGGVQAIRMAIEDCSPELADTSVQLLLGDHRNDPEVASEIVRSWVHTDGVDMIISGVNSDTSLAITGEAVRARCPVFVVGAGTTVQTSERASDLIIQYAYNTAALAVVPAIALAQKDLKRWFYLTADYPFGRELEEHGTQAVHASGGEVVGHATNAHEEENFIPFVQKALASGADVLGLANGHAALLHAIDALKELNATDKLAVVGLLTFVNDIREMGLERAQGLFLADSWYWTRDAETKSWAGRFFQYVGAIPSSLQAADYSATLQFLKAVIAERTTDWDVVLRHFRSKPLQDIYVRNGHLRPDGVLEHDFYFLRTKHSSTSEGPWDVYEEVAKLDGSVAFS